MGVCLRNKGKIEESIAYFKKSILFKQNESLTFFNLALSYQTLNDLNNAISHYQRALDLKPDFLEALNNLGNIFSDKKEYNLALPLFKKSIDLNPDYEMAHNNIGILYGNIGNLELAIYHYKKAININPKQSQAFNNLGNAYQKLGNKIDAEKSYKSALKINPLFVDAKNNLGTLLMDDEKYADAIPLFKDVINKNPNFSQAYSNLANVFRRIGNLKEAEKLNKLSLQIEPNNPSALNNIGLLLMDENKINLAIDQFLKAIKFEKNSKTIKNLGIAYQRNYEYEKALNQYKFSLKLNPNDAKTYCILGSCFKELNQFNNAIEAFDKALFLEPSNIYALSQKISTERQICLWNNFEIDKLNLQVTSYDQYIDPRSIMYLADNLEIEQKIARKYFKSNFVREANKISFSVKPKIRVGYYSADLITHAVTILIIRLFEIYDSEKFEIYVYNFGRNKDDKYTERIKKGVTIYRDVRDFTDSQIVDLSRKDEIDIAIDLMGYTKNCRPSIFSMRVAPIQISYLGFTGTMGTNVIDYIFADKVLIKENEKFL